jgi:hypothetical protein
MTTGAGLNAAFRIALDNIAEGAITSAFADAFSSRLRALEG